MEDERISGVKNALMYSNMSTFEIAKVYEVSHEEVLDIMQNLEYVVA